MDELLLETRPSGNIVSYVAVDYAINKNFHPLIDYYICCIFISLFKWGQNYNTISYFLN